MMVKTSHFDDPPLATEYVGYVLYLFLSVVDKFWFANSFWFLGFDDG